jgi:hypothetical protein
MATGRSRPSWRERRTIRSRWRGTSRTGPPFGFWTQSRWNERFCLPFQRAEKMAAVRYGPASRGKKTGTGSRVRSTGPGTSWKAAGPSTRSGGMGCSRAVSNRSGRSAVPTPR